MRKLRFFVVVPQGNALLGAAMGAAQAQLAPFADGPPVLRDGATYYPLAIGEGLGVGFDVMGYEVHLGTHDGDLEFGVPVTVSGLLMSRLGMPQRSAQGPKGMPLALWKIQVKPGGRLELGMGLAVEGRAATG